MVKVSFVSTTAPIQFRQTIRALFGSGGWEVAEHACVHVSDHVGLGLSIGAVTQSAPGRR